MVLECVHPFQAAFVPLHVGFVIVGNSFKTHAVKRAAIGVNQVRPVLVDQTQHPAQPFPLPEIRRADGVLRFVAGCGWK